MKYYLSCTKFTVQVNVEEGIIVWTAPITWKFVGQKFENLIKWLKADEIVELKNGERNT